MAVQIAAMLSQFAGAMVPPGSNRMGFIFHANSQRSGKTLLAKIAIMAVHRVFNAQSWKAKEEDLQKVIDAEVLAGSSYVCFDNVRAYVASPSIEGLMTSPDWTGRVLGETRMFTAKNRLSVFITGNELNVSPDMMHRCLWCDLFVSEGNVQEREVENLIDEVYLQDMENRRRILSALWAIVRAWHEAGMPKASSFGCKPRLGFERWCETIGGMVPFAGFGDCLVQPKLETTGNSEQRNVDALVQRLRDMTLADDVLVREFKFQEIVNECHDHEIFAWKLKGREVSSGPPPAATDWKLDPKENSTFGLMMVRFARTKGRVYRYRPGEKVMFSHKGEGRDKRYIVEIVRE